MVLPIADHHDSGSAAPCRGASGRPGSASVPPDGRWCGATLPYATPGILTGSVLSTARALGETAPLIMVGAVTGFLATEGGVFESLQQRFTSLPTLIFAFVKKPVEEFAAGCRYHPGIDRLHLPREPHGHPAEEPV